jgi:alpha-tubulin suppressor-like RCC1 family protein
MRILLPLLALFVVFICRATPPVINYAGQITANGEVFNGGGLFKFKIVEADDNATLWSNDGNNSNKGEPNSAIAIQVNGGLYSILLGNTAIPGMQAISPNIFQNNSNVKLQVWFSDGIDGFQKLTPDRSFASVPYAFSAGSAPIKEGSVTLNHLSQEVINELNSTIGRNRLSEDLKNEINATISKSRLSLQIQNELNATIAKDRLSSEIRSELNSTQTLANIVGMNAGIFDSGLKAYLRPILRSGINITSAIEDQVAELRAPSVEGRFLQYQWYKDGEEISDANSTSYRIAEFNSSRDAGEYEIRISNDFATLKTKAILQSMDDENVTYADSGHGSSYFIKSDGSLWAVGKNNLGQLGDGTNTNRYNLKKIIDANVSKVHAYMDHCLILKNDGSLWGMGQNYYGELSNYDVNSIKINEPRQILASGVTDMATGHYHTMILKSDGTLWAMGSNVHGQLGDGTTINRTSPVQITSGVTKVTCGYHHTLFTKTNGSLWAMGNNTYGQLGDGSTTTRTSPVQILSSGVSDIAAGNIDSLFVKTDGSLWGMGHNGFGQLGDGTNSQRNSPIQVVASEVAQVKMGYRSSTFLKNDGSLWAMGYNHVGQLGDGSGINRNTPVQIETGGVVFFARGLHTLFYTKSDKTLWASGSGNYANLGDGNHHHRYTPFKPNLLSIVAQGFAAEIESDVVERD